MNSNDIGQLQLRVFRPPVSAHDRPGFEDAFALWLKVWRSANAEMEKPTDISSDSFTRQSEIIALFKDDKPIAMICLRETDFDAESTLYDSIFMHPGMWNEEDKNEVRKLGGAGVFGSLITVDPAYRGTEGAISLKYLIVLLALERARSIGAETVVSIIRGKKGLDRLFLGAGFTLIGARRTYGSTFADLIAFQPQKTPIHMQPEYFDAVGQLWAGAQFSKPMTFNEPAKRLRLVAERKSA